MKDHIWEKEKVTIKSLPPAFSPGWEFWKCKECKASGGPVQKGDTKPKWEPFLAGTTLIDLSADCDKAKKAIGEYWEKYPASEPFAAEG